MTQLSPVVVFAYKRADKIEKCLKALQRNILADKTQVYLFADGAKSDKDRLDVEETRNFIREFEKGHGFAGLKVYYRECNMGLANSIITGVTEIIEKYGKVIVVEDDLITSIDFLLYMNDALVYYDKMEKIGEISAFTHPLKGLQKYEHDVYVTRKAECWGWVTWKDRWELADWEMSSYPLFLRNRQKKEFEKLQKGINKMLCMQMGGKLDSWAVRWCYSLFMNGRLTVYPKISRARNIGFDGSGVHCGSTNQYQNEEINSKADKCRFEKLDVNRQLEKEAAEFEYVSFIRKCMNYLDRMVRRK